MWTATVQRRVSELGGSARVIPLLDPLVVRGGGRAHPGEFGDGDGKRRVSIDWAWHSTDYDKGQDESKRSGVPSWVVSRQRTFP